MMNNELYHYGILGMHWGIRRYQPYGEGGYTPKDKKRVDRKTDKQVKKQRKTDMKNRRNLSDFDLDKAIDRLQKEKRLKELTEEDISPGKASVKRTLKKIGDKTIPVIASGALMYAGYVIVTGDKNPQKAAGYIFPNINIKKK